jgi:hypothetical protein
MPYPIVLTFLLGLLLSGFAFARPVDGVVVLNCTQPGWDWVRSRDLFVLKVSLHNPVI